MLPVLLLGIWVEETALQRERAAVTEKHLLLAINITAALDRYARDVRAAFQYFVATSQRRDGTAEAAELAMRMSFRQFCLIDGTGRVISRIRGGDTGNTCVEHDALDLLRTQATEARSTFTGVMADARDRPTLYLIQRVPGNLLAVGVLDTEYIAQLQKSIAFGDRGHAAIVDGAGALIAHPNPAWQQQMKNISKVKPVANMMAGQSGVTTFYSPALKREMITGYTTVPETGWGVMVPQPLEELEKRAADVSRVAFVLMSAGVLGAAMIGWLLSGIMARPAEAVVAAAKSLAGGDLRRRVGRPSRMAPHEFHELADAFNAMARKISENMAEREHAAQDLRRAHDQLENRVEQRTRDLTEEIAEREHAENARLQSEDRYRRLVETANVIAWELSLKTWCFTYVSPQAEGLLGYPIEAWKAENFWAEHLHPDDRHSAIDYCMAATKRGEDHDFEYRMIGADGRSVWLRDLVTVDFEAGEPVSLKGFMIDITEQKCAEENLRRAKEDAELANRAKSAFLANVSHELRTPLNSIIGFSDMLRNEILGPLNNARYREYTCDINESGNHLLAVINDLLDLSKIEAGEMDVALEPVNVDDILMSCAKMMRERTVRCRLTLSVEIDGGLPAILGDRRHLKQVVLNLLSNAIKFTPEKGNISVTAHQNDRGGVTIDVGDTGIGIAAEDIPRVLEPFGQVDDVLTRTHEGSGLGLSLAKSLTEQMGGTLEIESTPGKGTRVRLRFPSERALEKA